MSFPRLPSSVLQLAFRVTREGWLWLAATAALVGIGLVKSINLLVLLGCLMLTLWTLHLLLHGRRVRRLRGQRWRRGPIFAGTPASVALELVNPGPGALPAVSVRDQGFRRAGVTTPPQTWSWLLPRLAAGETFRCTHEVTLPTRGRYWWEPFEAGTRYPFGLSQRCLCLTAAEEVIVLPRTGRLNLGRFRRFLPPRGLCSTRVALSGQRHPTAQAEFHGLRTFHSGDSPRWIHWRTSARCGELMVREFEDLPSNDLIVVLDPAGSAALLEQAVSLAATICWEWCRQKGERLVLALGGVETRLLDGTTSQQYALSLLEALAVVQAPDSAPDATPLVDQLAALRLPSAPILLVSAGTTTLAASLGRLRRPLAVLDVSTLSSQDFYEGPPEHAP